MTLPSGARSFLLMVFIGFVLMSFVTNLDRFGWERALHFLLDVAGGWQVGTWILRVRLWAAMPGPGEKP